MDARRAEARPATRSTSRRSLRAAALHAIPHTLEDGSLIVELVAFDDNVTPWLHARSDSRSMFSTTSVLPYELTRRQCATLSGSERPTQPEHVPSARRSPHQRSPPHTARTPTKTRGLHCSATHYQICGSVDAHPRVADYRRMRMFLIIGALLALALGAGCGPRPGVQYIPGGTTTVAGQSWSIVTEHRDGRDDRLYFVRCTVAETGDATCAWHRVPTSGSATSMATSYPSP